MVRRSEKKDNIGAHSRRGMCSHPQTTCSDHPACRKTVGVDTLMCRDILFEELIKLGKN